MILKLEHGLRQGQIWLCMRLNGGMGENVTKSFNGKKLQEKTIITEDLCL